MSGARPGALAPVVDDIIPVELRHGDFDEAMGRLCADLENGLLYAQLVVEVTHLLNAGAVSYASLLAHPVLGQVVFAANWLRSADLTQQGMSILNPSVVRPVQVTEH